MVRRQRSRPGVWNCLGTAYGPGTDGGTDRRFRGEISSSTDAAMLRRSVGFCGPRQATKRGRAHGRRPAALSHWRDRASSRLGATRAVARTHCCFQRLGSRARNQASDSHGGNDSWTTCFYPAASLMATLAAGCAMPWPSGVSPSAPWACAQASTTRRSRGSSVAITCRRSAPRSQSSRSLDPVLGVPRGQSRDLLQVPLARPTRPDRPRRLAADRDNPADTQRGVPQGVAPPGARLQRISQLHRAAMAERSVRGSQAVPVR